jgi:hypothetical protein
MAKFNSVIRTRDCSGNTFILFGIIVFFLSPFHLFQPSTYAQDKTDARASVSGTLNCVNTTVTLIGNSDTPHARYTWTGPGNYRSTSQNATTAIPGDYTLKVIGAAGAATAIVKVIVDTISPEGVKASVSGMLTCIDTSVVLTGSSATPGVTYSWNGAKGISSNVQKIMVSTPGIYILKVTNPANGCNSVINADVQQNIIPPSGITATVSGALTCKTPGVILSAGSVTKDVIYKWSGPDFTSSLSKAEVTSPGKYTLTITDPVNGCSAITSVTAKQNIVLPAGANAMVSDTLTCKSTSVKLSATSATQGAVYQWSGPHDFTSTEQTTLAVIPGNYTVAITDPVTGCTIKKGLTVQKDISEPEIEIIKPEILTCKVKSVTLSGKPTSSKFMYNWNGPDNFSSTSAKPIVNMPGIYSATITKKATGCSTIKSVMVTEDTIIPEGVSALVVDTLSCATPKVKLTGLSSTLGVTYTWNGPQGFKSIIKNPEVMLPGKYTLQAINPKNGCTSLANVTVKGEKCKNKQKQ